VHGWSGRAERSPRGDSAVTNLSQIRLRTLPVAEANGLLDGQGAPGPGLRWHPEYPMAETVDALGMIVAAHRVQGWSMVVEPRWWLHQIVQGDLVVGDIGFHGPPAAIGGGEVEIGYNVVAGLRGRGIATRACALIVERAWRDGATVVRAEADPDNGASQQVLLRSGFRPTGYFRYVLHRPTPGSRR